MERRFTVYAMDRRGRGSSGDAPDDDLQREAEDIAVIVDSIGEPVNFHTGYKLDENDYHDVKALCRRLGMALPSEYKDFEQHE